MITIFIPAFNEENNIKKTVKTVINASQKLNITSNEIIVVNDGSTDSTKKILISLQKIYNNLIVINKEKNEGIGNGFKNALKLAKNKKIMIVPGDNDMPQKFLERMFQKANCADLVLGFWLNKEARGVRRNLLSIIYNTFYMVTFRVFIQYLNGPTIYPVKNLKSLKLYSNRFSITAESTIKILRSGCTYTEICDSMQTGIEGSCSVRLKNLLEVVFTFLVLIWEIYLKRKKTFNKKSKRVLIRS